MNETGKLINAALDSYPLVELPAGFIRRCMQRLEPGISFRLAFLDLALPVFCAAFSGVMMACLLWVARNMNPLWWLQLRNWLYLLGLYLHNFPLVQIFMAGMALVTLLALATGSAIFVVERGGISRDALLIETKK